MVGRQWSLFVWEQGKGRDITARGYAAVGKTIPVVGHTLLMCWSKQHEQNCLSLPVTAGTGR